MSLQFSLQKYKIILNQRPQTSLKKQNSAQLSALNMDYFVILHANTK